VVSFTFGGFSFLGRLYLLKNIRGGGERGQPGEDIDTVMTCEVTLTRTV
jgi:hypothetical protein